MSADNGSAAQMTNVDAERALLGAMLLTPERTAEVAGIVRAGDFTDSGRAILFEMLLAMDALDKPIDFVTVGQALGGDLDLLGGPAGLAALAESVTSAAHAPHHAKIIHDLWSLRRVAGTAEETFRRAHEVRVGVDGEVPAFLDERRTAFAEVLATDRNDQAAGDFLSAREFAHLPPLSWTIWGLIPEAALVVLFAKPGFFKTFLALAWVWAIATGEDWLGRRVIPGSAIFIVGEGVGGIPQRILALKGAGAFPERLVLHRGPINLLDPSAVDALISHARSLEDFRMLAVDTWSRCTAGGDENSTEHMSRAVEACDRIRQETGAAVLVLHHPTKDGKWERGSGVLRGAADVVLKIDKPDDRRRARLTCEKTKDAEPFPDIHIQADVVEVELPAGGRTTSCRLRLGEPEHAAPAGSRKADVVEALRPHGAVGAKVQELEDATKIPRATIYDALTDDSLFEMAGPGRYRLRDAAAEEGGA